MPGIRALNVAVNGLAQGDRPGALLVMPGWLGGVLAGLGNGAARQLGVGVFGVAVRQGALAHQVFVVLVDDRPRRWRERAGGAQHRQRRECQAEHERHA
jgi:hypothetical protein